MNGLFGLLCMGILAVLAFSPSHAVYGTEDNSALAVAMVIFAGWACSVSSS